MPKRTNEFQKLVFLVKKHAASDANVTESKLLRDLTTGAEREVDICVDSMVAGHPVVLSIECRNRGRRADVRWIEEMKAKHERLATNALVLISSSGFSKEAHRVARGYGIETLSLEALDETSAERLFGTMRSLWIKTLSLTPTKVVIRVPQTGELAAENVSVFHDNLIYNYNGQEIGSMKELVEMLLQTEHMRMEFLKHGSELHKGFEVHWGPARDKEGNPIFLKKMDPMTLRSIELVKILGSCRFEVSEFPLQHGKLGNVKVAWGSGEFMGNNAVVVASQDTDGQMKLSISSRNVVIQGSRSG